VFTAVLCHGGMIHVEPISTWRFGRSMFMNRVLPTICPDFRSIVANPTESPASCSDRTRSTYRLKSSIVLMDHGNQRNTSSKDPLVASQNNAECSSPIGSNRITFPSRIKGANSTVAGSSLTAKVVLQFEISRRRNLTPLLRQLHLAIIHARCPPVLQYCHTACVRGKEISRDAWPRILIFMRSTSPLLDWRERVHAMKPGFAIELPRIRAGRHLVRR